MKKIRNCVELRKAIREGEQDFLIHLNGGAISAKTVLLGEGNKFAVYHSIDGTFEQLTGRELYTLTNIGRAMKLGAFTVDER